MPAEHRPTPPTTVAAVIGVFFILYGLYALYLTAEPHPLYAAVSWTLALVWFGLAWLSRRGTRP